MIPVPYIEFSNTPVMEYTG